MTASRRVPLGTVLGACVCVFDFCVFLLSIAVVDVVNINAMKAFTLCNN